MSKLTLDEAIKHCLEVAENNEAIAQKIGFQFVGTTKDREATECRECAAEHRQLAEWLMELMEAKRLLRLAVEDINAAEACDTCEYYPVINSDMCQKDDCYKWRYADEALKLIGERNDTDM